MLLYATVLATIVIILNLLGLLELFVRVISFPVVKLGMVTDIYLRATKVRTRDNIEYLIPNSNLISNTIVNYSLSSPMIRSSDVQRPL